MMVKYELFPSCEARRARRLLRLLDAGAMKKGNHVAHRNWLHKTVIRMGHLEVVRLLCVGISMTVFILLANRIALILLRDSSAQS